MTANQAAMVWTTRAHLTPSSFTAFLWFVAIEQTNLNAPPADIPWLPNDSPLRAGAMRLERWAYLIARARLWEQGQSETILKARQLGFTWLACAYALYIAMKPGARVLIISKGQLEAYQFIVRVRFIWEHLPIDMRRNLVTDNDGELTFHQGGTITALPATENAGRGNTASLVIVDEAAFHPYGAQNHRAYFPTIADGGQLLMLSTANGATGFFADQWQKATHQVFIAWHERPARDGDWLERTRKEFKGLPGDFTAEYPATPEEAFVQLSGLVYPQFSLSRHVAKDPVHWADCDIRLAAYDLGGGDPTALVFLGAYQTPDGYKVHQFGEWYYREGAPTTAMLERQLRMWDDIGSLDGVVTDPNSPITHEDLTAKGWKTKVADWGRKDGLGLQAWFLEDNRLTIHPDCWDSIAEFQSYRWAEKTDPMSKERYKTSTAHDNHADAMDARRYGLMEMYVRIMALPRPGAKPNVAYSEARW